MISTFINEATKMENDNQKQNVEIDINKRDFVKKASYVAPAIITMTAVPSFASAGSGWTKSVRGNEGVGNGYDNPPPGHYPTNYNDFEGTAPGSPGHRHPRR